jgi:multidrug efflux pump subunit AcrA (membrane-fusion protein)
MVLSLIEPIVANKIDFLYTEPVGFYHLSRSEGIHIMFIAKRTLLNRSLQSAVALVPGITAMTILLTSCTKKAEEDPRLEPPVVPVIRVEKGGSSSPQDSYTGVVKARVESYLAFRVNGKITERLVDTGQTVHRGQLLYKLDRTDFAHAIAARQGSVASKNGDVVSKSGTVAAKESAVEAARARLIEAEADEKRYRSAVAVGVATEQAYDQYKASADTARAELKAALSEVSAAQAQVAAAQSEVKSLQAEEKVAENEGSYSSLVADCDGTVVEAIAEPGQVVAAGQTVVRLAHNGPREAVVNLPERLRPALNSTAQAQVYGFNGQVRARLRQLSDSADPATRTFEARYVLDGTAANAPLGSTVTVALSRPEKDESGIVVPLTALIDKGHGPCVWLLDTTSSSVHLHPVKINVLGNENVFLSSNSLKPGELLVAQGAHLLHENDKVRTVSASTLVGVAPLSTPPHESQ